MEPRFYSSKPPWMTLLWWLDRWRWVVFAGIAAVYVAGVNGRWRVTSDSAWYVLQARGGVGSEGVALGSTPPGLPVLIAAAGGGPGWGTALVMLGLAGAVLAMTYRMFVEHADRPTAVLMVLLLGVSGLFYELSHGLLTELPFMVGLVLLLWGHERRLKRKDGRWLAFGMMAGGVAIMAAFRSVAAVVVGAYLVAEVIRVIGRRDQRRLGLALIAAGLAVGAGLWSASPAIRDDAFFFVHHLQVKPADAWWNSVVALMTEALPEAVFGQDVPPVLAWPASVMAVAAMLWLVRARLLWAVLLGVFLLQWVIFLSDARYVLPVLPLVWYGVWRCAVGVLERWREPWRGIGFVLGALALVGANVVGVINTLAEQRSRDFYADYRGGKYAAVVEMAELIQRETPEDAELVVQLDVGLELAAMSERRLIELKDASRTSGSYRVMTGVTVRGEAPPLVGTVEDRRGGEVWALRGFE